MNCKCLLDPPQEAIEASYYMLKAVRIIEGTEPKNKRTKRVYNQYDAPYYIELALRKADDAIKIIYADRKEDICHLDFAPAYDKLAVANVHAGNWGSKNERLWQDRMIPVVKGEVAHAHKLFKDHMDSIGYRQPTEEEFKALGDGGGC